MKVDDVWRTHLSLTEQWRSEGRLAPNPQDCPGRMVCTDNDGKRPLMFECDECGLTLAVRQEAMGDASSAPSTSAERLTIPDDDDIPL